MEHAKLIKTLLKLFQEWFHLVEKYKSNQSVITFSDLLIKSLDILGKNKELKKELSEKYHHIMVDEFQDTTHSHWELIKSVSEINGKLRNKGIFIVGDEKQSIYRFNQADVTTFSKAIKDLKSIDSEFEVINLNWNFRSTENIINDCINPLFKNKFASNGENISSYMAAHQETISHAKSENKIIPDSLYTPFKSFNLDLMLVEDADEFKNDLITYPLHVAKLVYVILDNNDVNILNNNAIGVLMNAVKPVISSYVVAFT